MNSCVIHFGRNVCVEFQISIFKFQKRKAASHDCDHCKTILKRKEQT